jgi:hypothetical protein
MELFSDLSTAERIALGLLSFVALIVYLRWEGPPQDQDKYEPPEVPKRQAEND